MAFDKESAQIVSIAAVGFVLQYSYNIYLARLITATDYGDFAVGISMLLLLAMLVEIGASKTMPKYIHIYQRNGNLAGISGLLRGYITVTLAFAFIVAILSSGLAYFDLEITHKADSSQLHPLFLALWFLPLLAVSNILASSLKCIKPRSNSELPRASVYGLALFFLWLFTALGFQSNDWTGTTLFGSATFIVFVIYLFLTLHYVPRNYIKTSPTYAWREWLSTSLPIMVSAMLFLGTRQASLYMVEAFDLNEANVGYFSAASQTAQGLVTIYDTVSLIYGSRIGLAIIQGKETAQKTLQKMTIFMGGFCLFFILLLVIFGQAILSLFGPEYIQAYPVMILLTIGASGRVISGGYTTYLQYSGKQNQVLAVQFGILILSIILGALVIPKFSIMGAAVASTVCFIGMSVFFTVRAVRLLRKA